MRGAGAAFSQLACERLVDADGLVEEFVGKLEPYLAEYERQSSWL